jgi:hypothetical protein
VLVDDVLVDVRERAPAAAEAEFARREEDVTVRGAAAAGVEGDPLGAGEEEARPMDGGAAHDGGSTSLGFDEAGLFHDEKKSSSSAVLLVWAEALEVSTPSTTMPFGNLYVSSGVLWSKLGASRLIYIAGRTGLHLL